MNPACARLRPSRAQSACRFALAMLFVCFAPAVVADEDGPAAYSANAESAHRNAAAKFYRLTGNDTVLEWFYESDSTIEQVDWMRENPALIPVYLEWARDHELYGNEGDALRIIMKRMNAADLAAANEFLASPSGRAYTKAKMKMLRKSLDGQEPGYFEVAKTMLKHRAKYQPEPGPYFPDTPIGEKSETALGEISDWMKAVSAERIERYADDLIERLGKVDPKFTQPVDPGPPAPASPGSSLPRYGE